MDLLSLLYDKSNFWTLFSMQSETHHFSFMQELVKSVWLYPFPFEKHVCTLKIWTIVIWFSNYMENYSLASYKSCEWKLYKFFNELTLWSGMIHRVLNTVWLLQITPFGRFCCHEWWSYERLMLSFKEKMTDTRKADKLMMIYQPNFDSTTSINILFCELKVGPSIDTKCGP